MSRSATRRPQSRFATLARETPALRGHHPRRQAESLLENPRILRAVHVARPKVTVSESFSSLLTTLGSSWSEHRFENGGDWAVWNPSPTARFVIPEVRWAHLEFEGINRRSRRGRVDLSRGRPKWKNLNGLPARLKDAGGPAQRHWKDSPQLPGVDSARRSGQNFLQPASIDS